MVVDVNGDQHAGGDDERHQEDAEDQPDVQRVCTRHPVHGAVRRHHWNTHKHTHQPAVSQSQHV